MAFSLKKKLQQLVAWQRTPVAAPKPSAEIVVCKNCGTTFASNYCPRCGQSANTPRLGSKAAFKIFLDTWGLGTYGFMRTIWNLFARPGYMIGDYIDGHRQPYFPPFKTLFVVGTIFALVFTLAGGFSEEAKEAHRQTLVRLEPEADDVTVVQLDKTDGSDDPEYYARFNEQLKKDMLSLNDYFGEYQQWRDKNRIVDQMITYILFAFIAWFLFRKAPRRPKMNLAESIIAHVYICAQMGTAAIVTMLVSMPFVSYTEGLMPIGMVSLLFFYDYKQLYGYRLWGTFWRTVLIHILSFTIVLLLVLIAASLYLSIHASMVV